jgi:hypothetical protein
MDLSGEGEEEVNDQGHRGVESFLVLKNSFLLCELVKALGVFRL